MTNLSLIVWTTAHDERALARALESVKDQTLSKSQWDLLILSPKADPAPDWHPYARRMIDEGHGVDEGRGVSTALKQVLRHAAGKVLVLLQAGNALDPDFLSEAVKIADEWPRLGAWGSGGIDLEFEARASQSLRDLASQLARRNADRPSYSNVLTCIEAAPPGPGLCIRADIAAAYCNRPARKLPGESDEAFSLDLAAAELSFLACSMGFGMGVFPQLKLKRIIPASAGERQFLDYRQRESILRALLHLEWKGIRQPNPLSPAALALTARNILLETGIRRRLRLAEFKAAMKARRMLAPPAAGRMP